MSKISRFALLGAGVLALASCKSMDLSEDAFTVTPQILEAVGGEVPVTVDGTFPEKYFKKKAIVTVTPVLQWAGGSVAGDPASFQGQKIQGNNRTVVKKNGANYTITTSFPYQPEMRVSELYATFDAKKKSGKKIEIEPVKLADGVISTAELYANTAGNGNTAAAEDGYQRIIKQAQEANIMFLIQQANVRSSETGSDAIAALKEVMKTVAADTKNYGVENLEISAYASPDGATSLNENLAGQREKNATKYIQKEMKNSKLNTAVDSKYTAEDWDGFKTLVQESNLQDKELILSVLSMYSDPERRESEIKNISSVYSELADEILPQLRRARLTLNYQLIGRSDEEIAEAYASQPSVLSCNEILYYANLTKDAAKKTEILNTAIKQYPNDYRAYNNLAQIYFEAGQFDKAKEQLTKAASLNAAAAEVNTNLGLVALTASDPKAAATYLAKGAGKENAEALGNLYIAQGQYERALSELKGSNTEAEALALIMNKDYSGAKRVLSAIAAPTGYTYYLQAVAAARTNDAAAVAQNLKKAVAADPSLKAAAKSDVEFAKFASAVEAL